jgi:hypothetical protein
MEDNKLKEENEKLKKAVRFLYLTMGFYGTPFNYKTENQHSYSGILWDKGHDARYSMKVVSEGLGFTSDEISSWGGPFETLAETQGFSREHWTCGKDVDCNCLAKDVNLHIQTGT